MEKKPSDGSYTVDESAMKARNTEDAIYFNFSYAALKLLGKNLYNNAANAISELVANSIDAKALQVYVYIDMSDKAHSSIEIIDNGSGMSYSDLAEKYVWIGRNKRIDEELTVLEKRAVMGRKGIGKLAALYLSNQYYILTKKTSDIAVNQWEVNLSTYKDSDFPKLDRVELPISLINEEIWNKFNHGTVIKLNNVDLRRNGEKKIESLRRVFADFYLLDDIDSTIYVAVKNKRDDIAKFESVEKRIAYKNFYALFYNSDLNIATKMSKSIAFTWASKYPHIANELRTTQILDTQKFSTRGKQEFQKSDGSFIEKEYSLTGWIAIHCTIDQRNAVDKSFLRNNVYQPNRLRLYVRNKIAVEDYFSISPSTQAMANYIEGEISFDILDDDDLPDIATSSRQDFLEDERIELLTSIVDPILTSLYNLRNKVGKTISDANDEYAEELRRKEEEKRKAEEAARAKAEEKAKKAEQAQAEAAADAERERKRSKYILEISDVEDKNILNSVHSVYNMSCRVKNNLDEINNLGELSKEGTKKLEKASVSNQRILSMSKLITKAAHVIDDNDAQKNVNLTAFVCEYAKNVLDIMYGKDIQIECSGDVFSNYLLKIKPLSFIMMVDNIIGNAIKAASKTLTIIIDDSKPTEYSIIFKDTGKGLDSSIKDIERLFEFGVTTTNGSGLGLYYAKKQMKELKGSIEILPNDDVGVSIILSWKKERE